MICNEPSGCDREEKCRGMCSMHYQRWLTQAKESKYRNPFTLALWNRWLGELNSGPDDRLKLGITAFRRACHTKELQFAALRDMEIALETQL